MAQHDKLALSRDALYTNVSGRTKNKRSIGPTAFDQESIMLLCNDDEVGSEQK